MQKTKKRFNIAVVAVMVLSMLAMYAYVPVKAASLTEAKDTISDSDLGATANHVVTFTTGTALGAGEYMEVTLADEFGDIASSSCPNGMTTSTTTTSTRCTSDAGTAAGAYTINIPLVANPATAGSYLVDIVTKSVGGNEIETAQVRVYIIDDVTVSASVDASLTFSVSGLDAGTSVNGVVTTATTTATTSPFGTLAPNVTSTVGQRLSVGTNATDGFIVTVQQDHELTSAAGATINSFDNSQEGTGSTTPHAWNDPSNQLSDKNTWGHMGLTTSDDTAGGNIEDFSASSYAGLNGAEPMTVMSHDGPSNGTALNIGQADVAFSARITALQEAGDYTNTLTYICTPQF